MGSRPSLGSAAIPTLPGSEGHHRRARYAESIRCWIQEGEDKGHEHHLEVGPYLHHVSMWTILHADCRQVSTVCIQMDVWTMLRNSTALHTACPPSLVLLSVTDKHSLGQVAGFIFGGNIPASHKGESEKIAMTSPVVTEMKKGDTISMTTPVTTQMSNGK
ncbi:hypothetical protein MMC29_000571 [Sticta canariensis]|nr:hypothetical protein [Sticta canariensis]